MEYFSNKKRHLKLNILIIFLITKQDIDIVSSWF